MNIQAPPDDDKSVTEELEQQADKSNPLSVED
jgi:hypothetical protein